MKRKSIYYAAAIAAALALGMMAGCSSQPASQTSASSGSTSAASLASASASVSAGASDAAEKSQDEILAELEESLAGVPSYKSVTVVEKTLTWSNNGAEAVEESSGDAAESSDAAAPGAASESAEAVASSDAAKSSDAAAPENADISDVGAVDDLIESTTVYKFDESGDASKTSAEFELVDIKLQYYTDGDDAVCVTDGPVYSGTVEQFDLSYAAGADAYLKDTIGDLNLLVDCATLITQDEINGVIGYELTLDPEKYVESDEVLKLVVDAGDTVQNAYITVGFDKDGHIVWMTKTVVFSEVTSSVLLDLAGFDSTTIDPMPEATKTYDEMEADMQAKFDALDEELDS